jgi:hypothetical protein
VSTASALTAPGVMVPRARGPAATCCNAPAVRALEASEAAVLRRVCGFRALPVRCPVLCYHSLTQSGHRLASAPAQVWAVPPGPSPAEQVTWEALAPPAPAASVLSQEASLVPVLGVLVAFWWVPVTVQAEATGLAVAFPEYGWPLEQVVYPGAWDESVPAPAQARGGRLIGICIHADGMSSWQSIRKILSSPHAKGHIRQPCLIYNVR